MRFAAAAGSGKGKNYGGRNRACVLSFVDMKIGEQGGCCFGKEFCDVII
jgi:hypothetical protein